MPAVSRCKIVKEQANWSNTFNKNWICEYKIVKE